MAKVRFKFVDTNDNKVSIEVLALKNEHEKVIGFLVEELYTNTTSVVHLDVATAIKLSKALRTAINKTKEVEHE